MRLKDLKEQLRKESKAFVPDRKEAVLAQIPFTSAVGPTKRGWNRKRAYTYALSVLLIAAVGMTYFGIRGMNARASENSFVSVDINPSVEIEADCNDLVVGYRPLNIDAELLLEEAGPGLIGQPVQEAIAMIIDLAVDSGYLEIADAEAEIVVTVVNKNGTKEEALTEAIESSVSDHLAGKSIQGKLVASIATSEIKSRADELNISAGKLLLIERAQAADPTLTVEAGKALSVKRLNEIARGYDQAKIESFRENYQTKVETLLEVKETAIQTAEARRLAIESEISAIRVMVAAREPLSDIRVRTLQLIGEYFPHADLENVDSYGKFTILLNQLEEFTEERSELILEMIETKCHTQIEAFNHQMKNNIEVGGEDIDFAFEFDQGFEMENYHDDRLPTNTSAEAELLRIINQVSTLINVTQNNPHGQHGKTAAVIAALMARYEVLIDSPEVSQAFRDHQTNQEFVVKYQAYLGN